MKKVLRALAVLALAALAKAALPAPVEASAPIGGSWKNVCCGTSCVGGDYCLGSGTYTCCK